VPDQDGSGTVDAVGEGVDPVLVGERVWVWEAAWERPHGTAAEYTVVPARQVVLLGAGPSLELGAALGIPFLTGTPLPDRAPSRCPTGSGPGR
jgi:NADPH2:quinone reductase